MRLGYIVNQNELFKVQLHIEKCDIVNDIGSEYFSIWHLKGQGTFGKIISNDLFLISHFMCGKRQPS